MDQHIDFTQGWVCVSCWSQYFVHNENVLTTKLLYKIYCILKNMLKKAIGITR